MKRHAVGSRIVAVIAPSTAATYRAARTFAGMPALLSMPCCQGSGFGAHLEAGVELFRSSRVGALGSLRADAPFFALIGSTQPADGYYGDAYSQPPITTRTAYVVPLSINVALRSSALAAAVLRSHWKRRPLRDPRHEAHTRVPDRAVRGR